MTVLETIAALEKHSGKPLEYRAIDDSKKHWRTVQINKVGLPRNRFSMTDQEALKLVRNLHRFFKSAGPFFRPTGKAGGLSVTGINPSLIYGWEYCSTDSQGNIKAYQFFVLIQKRLYCFAFGHTGKQANDDTKAELTGKDCATEFIRTAKKTGIDMTKYARPKEEAKEIKRSIPKQLISTVHSQSEYYQLSDPLRHMLSKNKLVKVQNVCHIDLHESYMSHLIEAYPEFQAVADAFNKKYEHKIAKVRLSASIGYFQSVNGSTLFTKAGESDYYALKYDILTKSAMEGNLRDIKAISHVLTKAGYPVVGYNTDGVWFMCNKPENAIKAVKKLKLFTGFSMDYRNATLVLSGSNWVMVEGEKLNKKTKKYEQTFAKALRGNYTYANIKPYEDWNTWEDCRKALETHVHITCRLDPRFGFYADATIDYDDLSAYEDWHNVKDITADLRADSIFDRYKGDNFNETH